MQTNIERLESERVLRAFKYLNPAMPENSSVELHRSMKKKNKIQFWVVI